MHQKRVWEGSVLTQIKIIDAPVVDGSTDKIVKRLQEFLVRIRAANLTNQDELTENDAPRKSTNSAIATKGASLDVQPSY